MRKGPVWIEALRMARIQARYQVARIGSKNRKWNEKEILRRAVQIVESEPAYLIAARKNLMMEMG